LRDSRFSTEMPLDQRKRGEKRNLFREGGERKGKFIKERRKAKKKKTPEMRQWGGEKGNGSQKKKGHERSRNKIL